MMRREIRDGRPALRFAPCGLRVHQEETPVHFVIHAVDRPDALATRAKHYRDHRIHLDRAGDHKVSVMTAGTLVAQDGETPVGSLFILEAENRAAVDAFT